MNRPGTLTAHQQAVLALVRDEGPIGPRRVAGEFELTSQNAGRTLAALERRGLVRFSTDARTAGYVVR